MADGIQVDNRGSERYGWSLKLHASTCKRYDIEDQERRISLSIFVCFICIDAKQLEGKLKRKLAFCPLGNFYLCNCSLICECDRVSPGLKVEQKRLAECYLIPHSNVFAVETGSYRGTCRSSQ